MCVSVCVYIYVCVCVCVYALARVCVRIPPLYQGPTVQLKTETLD